jgi:DNA-binding MarR family transcriptional regulator
MSSYVQWGAGREHLGRLLLRAWRSVAQDGVALVRDRGHVDLRVGHLPVFGNIDAEGTRINVLAERAGVTRQMMGRLVKELEELGYVRASVDSTDRRAVVVSLTDLGWRFRADADAASEAMVAGYVDALGAARIAELEDTLRRLISVAGKGS